MIRSAANFFFNGAYGQVAAVAVLLAGLGGWFAYENVLAKGARNAISEIKSGAAALVEKGRVAADAVPDDGGNFQRLRQRYCGDC